MSSISIKNSVLRDEGAAGVYGVNQSRVTSKLQNLAFAISDVQKSLTALLEDIAAHMLQEPKPPSQSGFEDAAAYNVAMQRYAAQREIWMARLNQLLRRGQELEHKLSELQQQYQHAAGSEMAAARAQDDAAAASARQREQEALAREHETHAEQWSDAAKQLQTAEHRLSQVKQALFMGHGASLMSEFRAAAAQIVPRPPLGIGLPAKDGEPDADPMKLDWLTSAKSPL